MVVIDYQNRKPIYEQIVEQIFQRAEEHPEIIPDLKKMMDYYLPMTVKLLDAYEEMDRQPIGTCACDRTFD